MVSNLTYPTYREGLQTILIDPQTPWQQQLQLQQQQQQQTIDTEKEPELEPKNEIIDDDEKGKNTN